MASSQQKESDLLPLAASVGLFLVTTALSQWIQQGRSTTTSRDSDSSLDGKDFEELRRWYRSRRGRDRLSYENLQRAAIPPSALSDEEMQGDNNEETEWNQHHRKQRRVTSAAAAAALDTTVMHPNADSDFHPKNRNWRHFEHFNEGDRKRHLEKGNSERKISNDVGGSSQEQAEEEEEESSHYDESISSEGSGSQEEQFVWTQHHHSPHKASGQPSLEGKRESWPEAIRTGLTSLLSSSNLNEIEPQIDYMDAPNKPHLPPRTTRSLSSMTEQACGDGHTTGIRARFLQLVKRMVQYSAEVAEDGDNEGTPPPKVEVNNRILRALYNARIMPEKLVMIRHGQSMGNIDELLYSTLPDNSMPLTDLGWEQARAAGTVLKEKILVPGQTVHFIVSPYVRTVETFHGIASAWSDPKEFSHIKDKDKRIKAWYGRLIELGLTWIEDSRIREQDFGNYQDPETIKRAKKERHQFGVFYYRFPHGESASDVFDRVSTFLDSLWRSFEMNRSRNYVLVTHGVSIRVLLARYFRYTIDQFNILSNPGNCEMVVLGHNGDGRLELEGRSALDVEEDPATKKKKVTGYKFHKRLRIVPKFAMRKVKIRISPDE